MKFSFLGDFRVFLCSLCVGWLGLPSVYPSKLELLVWLVGNNNNNIECPILRTAENYTVHNTTTIGMFFLSSGESSTGQPSKIRGWFLENIGYDVDSQIRIWKMFNFEKVNWTCGAPDPLKF